MAGGIVPKIYSESDFADSAPKRTFTEDDFADKPDPSMWERLSSGFMGKEIAQPKGFDIGDVYEGIGSVGLETLGGTLGTPFGPAGIGLGAATGSALHSGIKNILNPETATTPLQTATRAGAEGLLQGTGAKYTLKHVERSIEFIDKYFKMNGFLKRDFITAMNIVSKELCTLEMFFTHFQTRC